jgi:tetratricopeptide (TPR) repeat protein
VRALHLVAAARDPLYWAVVGDSAVYADRARALLGGVRDPGHAFTPPFYPVLLAGLFRVAGEAFGWLRIGQAILGAAATVAVAIAGSRLFGRRAGIVAGIVLAAAQVAIFFDGEILAASPALALVALGVLSAARGLTGGGPLSLALLGSALATAAHAQPQVAALLPGGLVVALAPPGRGRKVAAFLGATALVFALGSGIQALASGQWVLISAGGGVNLAIGNHAGAEGGFDLPRGSGLENTRLGLFPAAAATAAAARGRSPLSPAEVSRYWTERTLQWIGSDPGAALGLFAKKLLLALHHRELPNHYSIEYFAARSPVLALSPMRFGLLLPLAAAGLVALARRRDRVRTWLWTSIGLYWLVLALFFITDRYRLLVWPYLALAAGLGVDSALTAWAARDRALLARMGAAALVALLLAFLPPAPRFSPGHMSLILSEVLLERGDVAGSRQALAAAAATGEIYEASHNLGNLYFKEHRYAEAAAEYERALALAPDQVETLYGLALTELERGEAQAAARALERAQALAPSDPRIQAARARAVQASAVAGGGSIPGSDVLTVAESAPAAAGADSIGSLARRDAARALYAQALADARAGRRAEARAGFTAVLRLRPADSGAHLNLALLAEAEGDLETSATELARAAELGANEHLEWLLCAGRVAMKAGREAEARARFERAQVVAPGDPRAGAALRSLSAAHRTP